MREYETTVVVQPEISEEGTQSLLQKMDGVLEKSGSTRLMCTDLGKRKLAYEVRKFQKGHYYVLSFLDDGKVVSELERNLRIEESVLRFMTVKVEDEVADLEARVEAARIAEADQEKRAAEKAAREAEEAKARAEVEAQAAEEARLRAEETPEADAGDDSDAGDSDAGGSDAGGSDEEGASADAASDDDEEDES